MLATLRLKSFQRRLYFWLVPILGIGLAQPPPRPLKNPHTQQLKQLNFKYLVNQTVEKVRNRLNKFDLKLWRVGRFKSISFPTNSSFMNHDIITYSDPN